MSQQASPKSFAMRSFVAFMVTWSFLAAIITGIILFVVPQGRIANWVEWRLFGLTKDDWAGIHIAFTFIFIIAGVLHLYPYNWKQWKRYLAERVGDRLNFARPRKEFLLSVALSALVVAGAIGEWPPIRYLFQANDWAKGSWVIEAAYEPPFGHAEEVSLATLTKRLDIDLTAAEGALRAKGLTYAGSQESLADIGAANRMSAMEVYALLKPLEPAAPPKSAASAAPMTADDIVMKFEGAGVGQMTIEQAAAKLEITTEKALERLKAKGCEAEPGDTMKEVAGRLKGRPMDALLAIALD